MVDPEGNVTPVQYEILQAVWESGEEGATVAEIWREISKERTSRPNHSSEFGGPVRETQLAHSATGTRCVPLSSDFGPGKNRPCVGLRIRRRFFRRQSQRPGNESIGQ